MDYIQGLIQAFGTPAVVIAIIAFLFFYNKKHTEEHVEILNKLNEAEKQNKLISDIYKISLRSYIVNPEIPVSARLDMYDIYKGQGFNSWIDKYVEDNLLSKNEEE